MITHKLKFLPVLAGTMFLLAFQGCSQGVKIADLTRDPGRYRDKQVSISGKVTQSYGALGTGAYQVDDGTGKIWVMSERSGVPGRGAEVEVSGKLIEGATFGGRSFGTALRESKRSP